MIEPTSDSSEPLSPTAVLIAQRDRLRALPRHFGAHSMLRVESAVYSAMREIATEYTGGYWHYYDLSNGGFYMAPDAATPFAVSVHGNYFSGSIKRGRRRHRRLALRHQSRRELGLREVHRALLPIARLRRFHAENRDIFRAID